MLKFEKVSRFADVDLPMPVRSTQYAAGYDFVVAEDIIIPSYFKKAAETAREEVWVCGKTLDEMTEWTKEAGIRPTLVSTGMKCQLDPDTYLALSIRSSCPLKSLLILANSEGIIDADYYNNPSNEGEIFFQVLNLSPYDLVLKRGDRIGQGIIMKYLTVADDAAAGARLGGFGSTGT